MSRKDKGAQRKAAAVPETPQVDSVCYCNGSRELGTLELSCAMCNKWFHKRCFMDLHDFYGLNYMVCYIFNCHDCSPTKTESWSPRQANFIHMCVTVLANITTDRLKEESADLTMPQPTHTYFSLSEIIQYIDSNWDYLTNMPRRVKNTWHATIQKTLAKETDLFKVNPSDENSFALLELDLELIGPGYEAVKMIGKKQAPSNNLTTTLVDQSKIEKLATEEIEGGEKTEKEKAAGGPKTRGATKRKNIDMAPTQSKKAKSHPDYSTAKIAGTSLEIPFNKEDYRYHVIERDPHVFDPDVNEENLYGTIPAYLYRLKTDMEVTLSPNDRACQLKVSDDRLSLTGVDCYCVARATHSVARGRWYYEVTIVSQPPGGAVRVGWAQQFLPVQSCVGYSKFSYGVRSLKGTKFHDSYGRSYHQGGFAEGDTIGCLIDLPFDDYHPGPDSTKFLPKSGKDMTLINFKKNYFFEENESKAKEEKHLTEKPGSRIEFFHNGVSCGVAFEDIYEGFYYPAVSSFGCAKLDVNFGPAFRFRPPEDSTPMSERATSYIADQALSDMLWTVESGLYPKLSQFMQES